MVWLKPEKPKDIYGNFQISGGIFRYLQASSDIRRYLQISVDITHTSTKY